MKQWERIRNNAQRRQDPEKAGTPSKNGKQEGRWETMEDDKGRQDLGKAGAPSNTNAFCGETMGDNGRQWETMGDKGGQNLGRQAHVRGDSGKQWQARERPEKADTPSQAHMWGAMGEKKGETRRREGGRTIQHRHTCGQTMGDNGRQLVQWETRGDKSSGRWTHHPTRADKGRQDLGKAYTPSKTCRETMGDKTGR